MRILILSLVTLVLAFPAFSAPPLLKYEFGNQAHESKLEIQSDGTIIHMERSLLDTKAISENPLSGAQLSQLKSWIKDTKNAGAPKIVYQDLSLGMEFGGLHVFSKSKKLKVRIIEEPDNDGRVPVSYSSAKVARGKLEAFVNEYVQTQLPDLDQ